MRAFLRVRRGSSQDNSPVTVTRRILGSAFPREKPAIRSKPLCTDGRIALMVRQAHLEAAKHHLEAASKHLDAAGKYKDGDPEEAERHSEEAQAASRIADGKSTEAHWKSRKAASEKAV